MVSRSQLKFWRSLLRPKGRAETGLFLIEGPRVVGESLRSTLRVEALLHSEAAERLDSEAAEPPGSQATGRSAAERLRALVRAFEEAEVPCHALSDPQLASVSDTRAPQGIVAVAAIPRWRWEDLGAGDLIVLDAVQDPGNVGTLLRAAEGLGMSGAVVLPGTAEPWSPKVTRAAAGSSFRLPILEVPWPEAEERLRRAGTELWAADAVGEELGRESGARSPVALVLGNEGAGVSPTILRECRRTVSVPLDAAVESLNVGVAGAILMDRLRASRRER